LRGLAILAVVLFHGVPFTDTAGLPRIIVAALVPVEYGWLGVNLFFVLSGFLITGILLDSKASPQYYKHFYIRRALRILPAYLLLLLLLLVVPKLGISDRQVSWSFVGLSLLYMSNFTNFFGVAMQYSPLWSLAVEEHFYLFWPTVVQHLTRRRLACCALALLVICPALRLTAFLCNHGEGILYTWMVADGLASGSLLAIVCRSRFGDRRRMKWLSALSISVPILLMLSGARFGTLASLHQPHAWGATLRDSFFNVLFTGILGGALLLGTSRWANIVHRPLLQFFGRISYGLYLIHCLVFDVIRHFFTPAATRRLGLLLEGDFSFKLVRFAIGGLAATLLAYLSRRYFEEPFLRLKDRLAAASAKELFSLAYYGDLFTPLKTNVQPE
jgi:peptidoglycan/LPS O-acetylase OafA/YrhL